MDATSTAAAPKKDHVRAALRIERSPADRRVILIERWPGGFSLGFCLPQTLFVAILFATLTGHPLAKPLIAWVLSILGQHP